VLVLSRKQNDKVVFPHLGITVQVIRLQGRTVRLGIHAPDDVQVLRHELEGVLEGPRPAARPVQERSHAMRNRVNAATIGLHLLRRQLETGQRANVESTISKVLQELETLESELGSSTAAPRQPPSNRRLRALLVEDNENERELLGGFLRSYDYDVVTAHDGIDALERLDDDAKPDVVLLDLNMPRLDGRATIQRIRSNPSHVGLKVFVVSGSPPDAPGSRPAGADRWFRKPIRPDDLVREIDRELSRVCEPALS
jgi:carbon storage regulator CsrA